MSSVFLPGLFVNREEEGNGRTVIVKVEEVDEFGARVVKLDGTGRWTMPLADYNAKFGAQFRPATPEDLAATQPPGYKPPSDVPDDWREGPADPPPAIGSDF